MTHAVQIRHLCKFFDAGENSLKALDNVSVDIKQNEFFTLLGPSGCGKTTLLRLIAGFETATKGEILLYGSNIARQPPHRRPINTVFQSYALFPHMTVEENIGFGLRMLGQPKSKIKPRVEAMLKMIQMEHLRARRTNQISGGQQQRVALARALAPEPKVLLLDEPLSALDYKLRKEMQIELKRLQLETGITFIFVTHDQEEALTMSDRIAVMSAGRIAQVGTSKEIYDHPKSRFVAEFIGETNFLNATVIDTYSGLATLRLADSTTICAHLPAELHPTGEVTAFIRPENARLASAGTVNAISGVLEQIIYRGTDTHFYIKTSAAGQFIVRTQSGVDADTVGPVGSSVHIYLEPRAVQIMRDSND